MELVWRISLRKYFRTLFGTSGVAAMFHGAQGLIGVDDGNNGGEAEKIK
jgi:hypothetical protein